MDITTIKLQKETKNRLDKLRENRNESYDDILRKILYVLNTTRDDPMKAKGILERVSELRQRMIESEKEEEKERKMDEKAKNDKKKAKKDQKSSNK
jgi:hypothetical protein